MPTNSSPHFSTSRAEACVVLAAALVGAAEVLLWLGSWAQPAQPDCSEAVNWGAGDLDAVLVKDQSKCYCSADTQLLNHQRIKAGINTDGR